MREKTKIWSAMIFCLSVFFLAAFIFDKIPNFIEAENFKILELAEQLRSEKATAEEKELIISTFAAEHDKGTSVSAAVEVNSFNQVVTMLKDKEIALSEKEKVIFEKENNFIGEVESLDTTVRFLTIFTLALLCLVSLNFYFDAKRAA